MPRRPGRGLIIVDIPHIHDMLERWSALQRRPVQIVVDIR